MYEPIRNYELVAKALNQSKPIPYSNAGVWEETCENIADAFSRIVPNFNREMFLKVCGV